MNPQRLRRNPFRTATFVQSWILLVVTVALSIGTEWIAYAMTFPVNSTVDEVDVKPGDGRCLTSAGNCTVRAAIMEANVLPGQDTIILSTGTYLLTISEDGEDATAAGDLDITGDLIIQGNGAGATVIQGGQEFKDRIIHVLRATVEMRGLTFRNGIVLGNGGGLRNQGGMVALIDCSVVGNRTTKASRTVEPMDAEAGVELTASGGGIFNTGILRIVRSSVTENIAANFGGGIASDTRQSSVILEQDFSVSNNTAVRGAGGGIFINRGMLQATSGRIANNKAGDRTSPLFAEPSSADAGGLGTDKRTSRASLVNVILSGNSSLEDGGAIENEAGTMVLTNCVVSENTTEGNVTPAGILDGQGGGIENDRGDLTVRNSRIVNNRSVTRAGGIHNANGILRIIQSTISGNVAKTRGGGVYNRENPFQNVETGQINQPCTTFNREPNCVPSDLTIIDSTLSNNTAEEENGGGIFNAVGATATVSNSTLARNFIFEVGLVAGGGSAIANFGTMTVSHSTVALNGPGGRGGGAIANGGELTISSTLLANNPFRNCSQFSLPLKSAGYNLASDSTHCGLDQTSDQKDVPAGLDPSGLQNNGGPTNTIALLPDSPAVDKGKAFDIGEAHDQRGAARFNFVDIPDAIGGDGSDIGAFELQMIDGTLDVTGGTITDNIFGTRATLTVPPGVLTAPTTVTIDVLDLDVPLPTGFSAPGTRFVNIELKPVPAFPLGPPGLTVVLPLVNPLTPGTRLDLFRLDPASQNLVPVVGVTGLPVSGTVNADGLSATFTGIASLSTIVGLIPAAPGPAPIMGDIDLDGDVDRDDLNLILAARNTPAEPNDPRDLNRDGIINALDARQLVILCTRPRCATQ